MSTTAAEVGAQSAAQQPTTPENAALLLERCQGRLNALLENAGPELSPVFKQFKEELTVATSRTVQEFAELPSVANALKAWHNAGLPPNDITLLICDVAALLDARAGKQYNDLAKLVGLATNATLAVAHVFSRAADEAAKNREEIARHTADFKSLAELVRANSATVASVNKGLRLIATANEQLAGVMQVHSVRGRVQLILAISAGAGGAFLLGLLAGRIFF
ncbi:MAG: hypothetical protein BWY57_00627 [Betaproteobacteria bacterium ADurb.Bin341]|nr:MAG: hypothetical protein BWY57_00627 [Betaproteobacteria bacterium ADurb.Bin341]